MRRSIFALLAAFSAASVTVPALGQSQGQGQGSIVCGEHGQVVAELARAFNEVPISTGLSSNGAMVEVFASEAGTFTIVVTHVSGLSCLLQSGTDWETSTRNVAGHET